MFALAPKVSPPPYPIPIPKSLLKEILLAIISQISVQFMEKAYLKIRVEIVKILEK